MATVKSKIEVTLQGEFTTIDVFLEGNEIPLREINDNEYYKLYNEFAIQGNLDIHIRLKGWVGMEWKLIIKLDDVEFYSRRGSFDSKGYVIFSDSKIVNV